MAAEVDPEGSGIGIEPELVLSWLRQQARRFNPERSGQRFHGIQGRGFDGRLDLAQVALGHAGLIPEMLLAPSLAQPLAADIHCKQ